MKPSTASRITAIAAACMIGTACVAAGAADAQPPRGHASVPKQSVTPTPGHEVVRLRWSSREEHVFTAVGSTVSFLYHCGGDPGPYRARRTQPLITRIADIERPGRCQDNVYHWAYTALKPGRQGFTFNVWHSEYKTITQVALFVRTANKEPTRVVLTPARSSRVAPVELTGKVGDTIILAVPCTYASSIRRPPWAVKTDGGAVSGPDFQLRQCANATNYQDLPITLFAPGTATATLHTMVPGRARHYAKVTLSVSE